MEDMVGRRRTPVLDILYLDDHVAAVNKPPGVPVVPLRSGEGASLHELLGAHLCGERLYVVHRIDREASGVVVFAREKETHRALSLMFEHRQVKKTYLAVVRGRPDPAAGTIELPLECDPRDPTRMVVARRGGKPSRTDYRTLDVFHGYSLVELKAVTGRMHQLRVHLAAIGNPLAVDPVYGGSESLYLSEFKRDYRPKKNREERPLISRLSLHARDIRFNHPVSGVELFVEAPLPHDFELLLKQLSKHAAPPCER
jgi:23S rRNA pseudouridine955/2504/2580 synthase/23S rRNA pseudouridine1911/1915/1917 synthase